MRKKLPLLPILLLAFISCKKSNSSSNGGTQLPADKSGLLTVMKDETANAKRGGTMIGVHPGVGFARTHPVGPQGAGAGLVVSAAVLAHDFADGLNTVNVVTRNGGERKQALRWLMVDALAPVAGAALSLFVSLSPAILGLLLAAFAGFFIQSSPPRMMTGSVRNPLP